MVGEKGGAGRLLRVRGVPGHGSAPWGARNAGVIAAEAVTRLARFRGPTVITPQWRAYAEALDLDDDVRAAVTDPTRSSTDTPLFSALEGAVRRAYPSAHLLPTLGVGGTGGRFYRRRGVPAYGFGVLSEQGDYGTFRGLFHGRNERIDLASIDLTVHALNHVVRTFHGGETT